jgi:CheY-like chemotaxis protein
VDGAQRTHNAPQALAVIATAPPDLIFMDLRLPLLDSWEAIRRIRVLAAPLG